MSHDDDPIFSDALKESIRLATACQQAKSQNDEARAKLLAATEKFAAKEISQADVTAATEACVRSAADLRACRLALWKHDAADNRDYDEELRVAFETDANWLALHTALREAYQYPVDAEDAPFPTVMLYVAEWVVDACFELVTTKLSAPAPHRGARRWLTRYRQSLKDQNVWVVFQWCRQQGLSFDDAKAGTAEYFKLPEPTVHKAVLRIKAIRDAQQSSDEALPVFKPIYPAGLGDDEYPLEKGELNKVPLTRAQFDGFLKAVDQTPRTESEEGTEAAQARRLLEFVSSVRVQSAR